MVPQRTDWRRGGLAGWEHWKEGRRVMPEPPDPRSATAEPRAGSPEPPEPPVGAVEPGPASLEYAAPVVRFWLAVLLAALVLLFLLGYFIPD